MSDQVKELTEAIEHCDRKRQLTAKSSPVQIAIYNAFNRARNELNETLALVQDAQGTYTKGQK